MSRTPKPGAIGIKRFIFLFLISFFALDTSIANANIINGVMPPADVIANAGTNYTITNPLAPIYLDGTGSAGNIISYQWTQISGPNQVDFNTPNEAFTYIYGLSQGVFVFELSLNGGVSTSRVTITTMYIKPVARILKDITIVSPKSTGQLQGVMIGYNMGAVNGASWTEISGPNSAALSENSQGAGVDLNLSGLIQGVYVFQFKVLGPGGSDSTTATVTVLPPIDPSPFIFAYAAQTPAFGTFNDHQPTIGHEVGIKFTSSEAGYIRGIRFYKTVGNSGTHIGELYDAYGTRLAQANFQSESETGWQNVFFLTPVAITANTVYTAAYFSSLGNYTEENGYFSYDPVYGNPLTAPADLTSGASGTDPGDGQGTYVYTASPSFPNQLYKSANYWVDAIFSKELTSAIANAGGDQIVQFPGQGLVLNGLASSGDITSFHWSLISGSSPVLIDSPNSAYTVIRGVDRPDLKQGGVYVFELSINGGSSIARKTITVNYPKPIANVSNDMTIVAPLSGVQLSGDGPDGSHLITDYSWSQISGPTTATAITRVAGIPAAFISIIYLNVGGLVTGEYVFQFNVTGPGGSDSKRVKVTVLPPELSPNIFSVEQKPLESTSSTGQGIELGVKFKTSIPGYITGIKFYKSRGNSGTHIGELYSADGTRLAQAIFTKETKKGWQTVLFSSPVAVSANTTYIAAYFSSDGKYTVTPDYFKNDIINNPLSAVANGYHPPDTAYRGFANGIFQYSSLPVFPSSSDGNADNYWVDVVYTNASASVQANAGENQNVYTPATSTTLNGSGSTGPITSYLWTLISSPLYSQPQPVITSPNSITTTITGLLIEKFPTPFSDNGYYVFQLSINGGESVSRVTIHVLEGSYFATGSIFTSQTPVSNTENDNQSTVGHEVGVKFTSNVAGNIYGIRFYKTAGNTGTHIGELYSSTGERLAQATFTNETESGWQKAFFPSPVAITANTTYTAAYFSSLGNYTEDNYYFYHHAETNGPLTAPEDGTNAGQGMDPGTGQGTYVYTSAPAFPNQLYESANYWVDPLFNYTFTQTNESTTLHHAIAVDAISTTEDLKYFLGQNSPNPTYGLTRIEYSIPVNGKVELVLTDMQGRVIKVMVNENKNAGSYSLDLNTSVLAKGMYIYSMHSGKFHEAKKLVVQ